MAIIDRRAGYNKKRNLSNRSKYFERIKEQAREAVNRSIEKDKIEDLANGKKVKVKIKNTAEPNFSHDRDSGDKRMVHPGNRHFDKGDKIAKPQKNQSGGRGKEGSQDDDSTDEFIFELNKEEYLDILFEDLELPDLVKKNLKNTKVSQWQRSGYSTEGNPSNLDVLRTTKNAIGRRIALKRPSKKKLKELEEQLEVLLTMPLKASVQEQEKRQVKIEELEKRIKGLKRKQSAIPYYDPLDVRYRRFEKIPQPVSHAVMFCIMDVSGSMGQHEKDIAKRFFLLLYMFLTRKYETVEIRFIRHTTSAQEVDEQTFFYDPLTGGTTISSALELTNDLINQDYDTEKTNIYIAQASDGENFYVDNDRCVEVIEEKILKLIQYYAYIEIAEERDYEDEDLPWGGSFGMAKEYSSLWETFNKIAEKFKHFKCKRIADRTEIFDVFVDLFRKKDSKSE